MQKNWRVLVVLVTLLVSAASGFADDSQHLALTQQDKVEAFDFVTGRGYQVGTATGVVSGTTFVDFQFFPTGPPDGDVLPIAFSNKVIITDFDGDQLFFDNEGTGSFHLGVPGADFRGSGGPLQGTYVITGGTGKFSEWEVGKTYDYRAIATNPPIAGALGTVRVRVSTKSK
jgi:hypothetical protein